MKAVEAKAENVIEKAAENKTVELAKPAENKAPEQPKAEEKKPVETAKKPEQPKAMDAVSLSKDEKAEAKPAENKAPEQPKAEDKKPAEAAKKPEQPKEMAAIEPSKTEKAEAKPAENKAPEQPKAEEKKPAEPAKKPEQPKEMEAVSLSKTEKAEAKPAENKAPEQPKAEEKKSAETAKKPEQPKAMEAVSLSKDEKSAAKPAENKAPEQPKAEEKKPAEAAKKSEQPKEMEAVSLSKTEKAAAKPAENKAPEQPKAEEKKPVETAKKSEQPKAMEAVSLSKDEKAAAKPAENKAPEQPKAEDKKPAEAAKKPVVPPPPVKPAPANNIPVQQGFGNIPPHNTGNNPNGVQNPLGGAAFIGSIDDINKYVGNGTAQSHGETQSLKGLQSFGETETSSVNKIDTVTDDSSPLIDLIKGAGAALLGTIPGFVLWLILGKASLGLSVSNLISKSQMFVCPILIGVGALIAYLLVNKNKLINKNKCILTCIVCAFIMIALAVKVVYCMQIVDICNNLKDWLIQGLDLFGFSTEELEAKWDDAKVREAMKEVTGHPKMTFGICFSEFKEMLEKFQLESNYAWDSLVSGVSGIISVVIGSVVAKKRNLL